MYLIYFILFHYYNIYFKVLKLRFCYNLSLDSRTKSLYRYRLRKEPLMSYNSVILQNYGDDVKELVNNKAKFSTLKRYIERYIDQHSEQLNYIAPTKRLIFSREGNDGMLFLNSLGIRPQEMTREIKSIKSVAKISDVIKEPVFVTLTLIIRQLIIDKREKEADLFLMYLTLGLYSSIQYRTFKYEPNENVVNYTLSRISNKFYFKQ